MPDSVVIIVSTDPRCDPRTAEALRVAAGLAVNERLRIEVFLHGEAARLLDPRVDPSWLDETRSRHTQILLDQRVPIRVLQDNPALTSQVDVGVLTLSSSDQIAALCAGADALIRF